MSTLQTTLRRAAAPVLATLVATLLAGCGGGGAYGPYAPAIATLEVRNDPFSFEGIDFVEISQPFGPIEHFDVYLAPGDRDFIDLFPDLYDVDLYWSDGTIDSYFDIDLYDGSTTVLTGVN